MKYATNSALGICLASAILWLAGCTPATHVTQTTTGQYDAANPPVTAPAANSNTTTTAEHGNAAVQGTYKPPDKNTPYRWSGTNAFYVQ